MSLRRTWLASLIEVLHFVQTKPDRARYYAHHTMLCLEYLICNSLDITLMKWTTDADSIFEMTSGLASKASPFLCVQNGVTPPQQATRTPETVHLARGFRRRHAICTADAPYLHVLYLHILRDHSRRAWRSRLHSLDGILEEVGQVHVHALVSVDCQSFGENACTHWL